MTLTYECFERYIYNICQRERIHKKLQNRCNPGFSYYFYSVIEGSNAVSRSIPLTDESGSISRGIKGTGPTDLDSAMQHCHSLNAIEFQTGV
jgi:hypothetical protein